MFAAIKTLISKWFRPKSSEPKHQTDTSTHSIAQDDSVLSVNQVSQHDGDTHYSDLVPYDESLLERSRTQWQFGDWESLAALNRETLQHHPDRAKLALLAAAGKMQKNQMTEARYLIQLAQDWGVRKKLINQILISNVHNSIGRAASLSGQSQRALSHFEKAILVGAPDADSKLIISARKFKQLSQLGLFTPEGNIREELGVTATITAQIIAPLERQMQLLTKNVDQQQSDLIKTREALKTEKKLTEKLQIKSAGRDEDIDELIDDLSLFFHGRYIVYVDVGAYIGAVFKKIFDSKRVKIREAHLYEPNPESYAELKKNIVDTHSMHAHNLAIGKKEGFLKLISSRSMTKVIDAEFSDRIGNVFEAQCPLSHKRCPLQLT